MIRLLATFFYLGKSPWIPGTVGTLGGIPLVMVLFQLGSTGYVVGACVLTLTAIIIAQMFETKYNVHDSHEVVIDEVVGYVIAMAGLPPKLTYFVAAFVIFRLLDGLKPFPINYIDRHIHGGVGTVSDDILAGVITNLILQVILKQTQ